MSGPWKSKRVSEFARTGSGGTPNRRESRFYEAGVIPWVKSGELKQSPIRETEEKITEEALRTSAAKIVPAGAILIALYGATVGECAILGINAATNQAVCSIVPDETECNPRFLYHYLRYLKPYLLSQRTGGAQPNISQALVKDLEIPLPPLPQQHRIVEILDQADALRQQRRQADQISRKILPALFQEMFGDRQWPKLPVSTILRDIQGGWSPVCESRAPEPDEWGVLKLGSATYCEYRASEAKALPLDQSPRPDLEVKAGDLLFTRKNTQDLVGASAYVFETPTKRTIPDLIFRLIPDPSLIDPIYLWQALIEPTTRDAIRSLASGAAASMVNISRGRLLPLELPVPPLELQKKFAAAVLSLRAPQQAQTTSAVTLETLFQTLLHRAFDGTLTAKWREAHAKELLQEIEHQAR